MDSEEGVVLPILHPLPHLPYFHIAPPLWGSTPSSAPTSPPTRHPHTEYKPVKRKQTLIILIVLPVNFVTVFSMYTGTQKLVKKDVLKPHRQGHKNKQFPHRTGYDNLGMHIKKTQYSARGKKNSQEQKLLSLTKKLLYGEGGGGGGGSLPPHCPFTLGTNP